jgi:hypothetical protein
LPASANSGECAVLGSAGTVGEIVVDQLTITHGRGNPETLGAQAQYKLWVVGDPGQSVHYTLSATWFFGPDC